MPYAAGFTRYKIKKWMDALAAEINAGGIKLAIHSGSPAALDRNADPAVPLTYAGTIASELTSAGTGYTTGGYVLDEAVVEASGNAYQIKFSNVAGGAGQVTTGAGTIAIGTYTAAIYDTLDSNRIIAICTVSVTVASSGGAMVFTIPADALKLA